MYRTRAQTAASNTLVQNPDPPLKVHDDEIVVRLNRGVEGLARPPLASDVLLRGSLHEGPRRVHLGL